MGINIKPGVYTKVVDTYTLPKITHYTITKEHKLIGWFMLPTLTASGKIINDHVDYALPIEMYSFKNKMTILMLICRQYLIDMHKTILISV